MAYEIKKGGELEDELRRAARRQARCAVRHLKERNARGVGESVHEARKNLKKIRGLIRLVRANLGKKFYNKENRSFRDIAKVLSARRDVEVLIKTLKKFRSAHRFAASNPALTKLHKSLIKQEKEVAGKMKHESKQVLKNLKSARRRTKDWPIGKIKRSDLCIGFKATYRRGRRAFQKARTQPSPENLHEWRKRVKDLGYHFALLKQFGSKRLGSYCTDLTLLGDRLGDDHDLVMLATAVQANLPTPHEFATISKSIDASRKPLQKSVFRLGKKLYAEIPKTFVVRIKKDWARQRK
ncbi:CHAD domain-containing protein [Pedosphaera parvula]|uniref:CHAD domain containing protein n=1 Tax=Pedosphaera parvula (strain Ellin514) TaxID=320771 RepID=B9XL06_PEDPL|nr:CHAD domain-containing protein [Pedosphaera parvula]EEF59500.1 CHAD domain containing protein [Pedosphaera parvula Ellin514]